MIVAQTLQRKAPWLFPWHGFFYAELIIVLGITLWQAGSSWEAVAFLLALAVLLGGWYSICILVPRLYWRSHPLITQGYLAIHWGLWLVAAIDHPFYWFLLFGLCSQVYLLSRGLWKLPGILILNTIAFWRLTLWTGGHNGFLLLFLSLVLVGFPIALHLESMSRQNQEKDRLVHELESTRHELALAARQAGVMQERQRLAHEIHDTLAQGFTSIILHVEAAESTLSHDGTMLQQHLEDIRQTARENLVEARRLMWALQPEALGRAPLPDVLMQLCKRWSEENGIAAHMGVTGTIRLLRPEIEVTFLRIAQEGLMNARKHAQASQVTVTLSYMDDMVMLDVQDNGSGFATLSAPITKDTAGGFGLQVMHERVEHLGGTFSLESTSGEGTTLAVALPALAAHSPEPGDAATLEAAQ
ncbi:MAG: sensor histidine kinase [Chloroflexota bacterium]|nr:sensor histidine kinase [Chloroflexota bacterium]